MDHLASCAEGQPDDADHDHTWSGWPGAYCTICHVNDPAEWCLGGCECECHREFWTEYLWYQMEESIKKYEDDGWLFSETEAEDGTFGVRAERDGKKAFSSGFTVVLDAWVKCLRGIDEHSTD